MNLLSNTRRWSESILNKVNLAKAKTEAVDPLPSKGPEQYGFFSGLQIKQTQGEELSKLCPLSEDAIAVRTRWKTTFKLA